MRGFFRTIILVILLISIFTFGKDIYEQVKKFGEIRKVEVQSKQLEEENKVLKESLSLDKSKFNLEKQARDKLNYKKRGDTLYVVDLKDKVGEQSDAKKENWEGWLELFFK